MAQFRKKPVTIEAELFDRDKQHHMSAEFRQQICRDRACDINTGVGEVQHGEPHIHTLEGAHIVSDGDWIIKGVKGEFYSCKPDIFEATYERVEAAANAR